MGIAMMPSYIALTGQIRPHGLVAVATPLQARVTRDFLPEWGANTITQASSDAIPAVAIPLIV
jgi:hypothetical protein